MEEIEETSFEETNVWLVRKAKREQFEYRREFLRALSQRGSWIIDWDAVNEKSFGKKVAAKMKKEGLNQWHF